jgi:hypothetical protein
MSSADFHRWTWIGALAAVMGMAVIAGFGCQTGRADATGPSAPPSTQDVETGDVAPHSHEHSQPVPAGDGATVRRLESMGGAYVVEYRTEPATIPLNELFSIHAIVMHVAGDPIDESISLTPDARMPHHRHGMNTMPAVARLGPGQFLIEGMMFHMPGRWEIYFDMTRDGETERAMDVVELE